MKTSYRIACKSTPTRFARSVRSRVLLIGVVAAAALAATLAGSGIIGDGPRKAGTIIGDGPRVHLAGAIIGDGPRGSGVHLTAGIIGDRPAR